jgi:GTP-binding protein Era
MVTRTLSDADAVLFVIDASAPVGPGDRLIAERLAKEPAKVVVAVNKVDLAKRTQTVSQLLEAAEWPFTDVFPVSAVTGDGVTELTRDLVSRLEEGPAYYPEGVLSDQPEEMVVSEIIREKFLDRLREELPHSVMVRLEEISQRDNGLIDVRAKVVVERDSQRGIVLGKGGELLKAAGTEARQNGLCIARYQLGWFVGDQPGDGQVDLADDLAAPDNHLPAAGLRQPVSGLGHIVIARADDDHLVAVVSDGGGHAARLGEAKALHQAHFNGPCAVVALD